MKYAYAAIREGIPYANAAPNLTADIPALSSSRQKQRRRSPEKI
jgi:myo-inositol-1-phosphate synthase